MSKSYKMKPIEKWNLGIALIALSISILTALSGWHDKTSERARAQGRIIYQSFRLGKYVTETARVQHAVESYQRVLDDLKSTSEEKTITERRHKFTLARTAEAKALVATILDRLGMPLRVDAIEWWYADDNGPSDTMAKYSVRELIRQQHGSKAVEAYDAGLAYGEIFIVAHDTLYPIQLSPERFAILASTISVFLQHIGIPEFPSKMPEHEQLQAVLAAVEVGVRHNFLEFD